MQTLRYYKVWLSLGWFIVVSIIYLSLTPNPPDIYNDVINVDKLKHVFAYFVLMGWFTQLYQQVVTRVRYAIIFFLMGVSMELLQSLSQERHFEYLDMLANGMGIVLALLMVRLIKVEVLVWLERYIIRVE